MAEFKSTYGAKRNRMRRPVGKKSPYGNGSRSFLFRGRPILKHQIIICIVLVIAFIFLKKMDNALVNNLENVFSAQLQKDYTVGEIYETMSENLGSVKTMPTSIANKVTEIAEQQKFTSPTNDNSVIATFNEYSTLGENDIAVETHKALSFTSSQEIQVFSIGDGSVDEIVKDEEGKIKSVKISHKKNISSVFTGLDYLYVNVGDTISRGQILGSSNQEIVRLEMFDGGDAIDPTEYIDI